MNENLKTHRRYMAYLQSQSSRPKQARWPCASGLFYVRGSRLARHTQRLALVHCVGQLPTVLASGSTGQVRLVKKQAAKARFAQTENLARKALTACPELHSLDWQWKSEKHGGGHGNYLHRSCFPTPPALKEHITVRKNFGNGGPDVVIWEIQFANAWRGTALQLWPHKHYGVPVADSRFSNGRDTGTNNGSITAAWCLNERMRGVELHFTRRPDDAALAPLRGDRAWRYTGKTKCWYARQTPETIVCAKAFCEHFNGAPVLRSSPAEGGPVSDPARLNVPPRDLETNRVPSPVVPSPIVSGPIVPRLPAEASERRPERKIIRFTDTGHEGIGSSRGIVRELNPAVGTWTPVPAERLSSVALAQEGEVLQREYLNSQGRAEFYEANPAPHVPGALINVAEQRRI